MSKQRAQVPVPALADTAEHRAPVGRALTRRQLQPRRELAPAGERLPITRRRHQRTGHLRPDPWNRLQAPARLIGVRQRIQTRRRTASPAHRGAPAPHAHRPAAHSAWTPGTRGIDGGLHQVTAGPTPDGTCAHVAVSCAVRLCVRRKGRKRQGEASRRGGLESGARRGNRRWERDRGRHRWGERWSCVKRWRACSGGGLNEYGRVGRWLGPVLGVPRCTMCQGVARAHRGANPVGCGGKGVGQRVGVGPTRYGVTGRTGTEEIRDGQWLAKPRF